jgi:multiple sugar transport system substrate-binding protein
MSNVGLTRENEMKRLITISLFLSVLAGVCVFAGGGQQSTKSDAPVELVYWSNYGQSPAFVQAFGDSANMAFKKLGYNNVTCRAEIIEYASYETKYLTAFASGTGPDMFLASVPDFAMEGGVNPVAIPFPTDLEKLWTDALAVLLKNSGMFQGKRYGFPAEGEGLYQFLYINTDHFKEAGLDPARDYPKNVDEFITVAKKLTKYDAAGKIIRSGYQPRFLGVNTGVAGKFISIIHQFDGRVLSEDLKYAKGYINGPQSIAAFQFYQDLVTKHKVSNLEFGAPETSFQSGQTSMIFREGYFAQDTVDKAPNIKFAVLPYISGVKNAIPTQGGESGWTNMINAKSKHVDLCFELFKEFVKPEYDVALHEPGKYTPVLAATMNMQNPYFGKLLFAQAIIDSMSKGPAPSYDTIAKWGNLSPLLGDSVAAVLNGANVKTELDDLAEKMQVILDQK